MSYVEIGAKDLARMLSIMSDYFGKKEMSEDDVTLRKKLEVMHKSEIEWQKEQEEEQASKEGQEPDPEQQAQQMQGALQANNEALRVFLEKNDLVMDWQEHLEELNKEAEENAIQESGTTKVDAQE